MGIAWITAGLMLLLNRDETPEQLIVEDHGQNVAKISRADYTVPLLNTPIVDTAKLNRFIDSLEKKVYRDPVNATIDAGGNIVPERLGARLDRSAFTERFYNYYYGLAPSRLEVPLTVIYSKVDSELLSTVQAKTIGYYVTYFNGGNQNRYHNITLAAKAINSHVVFPGETFSFNGVVGARTAAKGYKRAAVIVRGEFSEGIGGGICQVSSTLFNAADRAGLHIEERYSHSRRVPYVPNGRDATVNWGGPDFRFTNKYNQPILIRTFLSRGQIAITISSSDAIVYKQRHVPSASKVLPEEITDFDVNRDMMKPGN